MQQNITKSQVKTSHTALCAELSLKNCSRRQGSICQKIHSKNLWIKIYFFASSVLVHRRQKKKIEVVPPINIKNFKKKIRQINFEGLGRSAETRAPKMNQLGYGYHKRKVKCEKKNFANYLFELIF